jgi:hypothetical protein
LCTICRVRRNELRTISQSRLLLRCAPGEGFVLRVNSYLLCITEWLPTIYSILIIILNSVGWSRNILIIKINLDDQTVD